MRLVRIFARAHGTILLLRGSVSEGSSEVASAEKPRVGARFAPQAARAWTPRGPDGAMFRAIDAAALSRAEATRGVVARAIARATG